METYDYIIAGGGAAGLSLLYYMLQEPQLGNKRILLIDKEQKRDNDRTWCFWETGNGPFDPLLSAQWDQLYFHSPRYSSLLNISPYRYKMLRSKSFYQFIQHQAAQSKQLTQLRGTISHIDPQTGIVTVDRKQIQAQWIFSSLPKPPRQHPKYHYLLQHFKGWFIQTPQPAFDTEAATLMDFRIDQEGDCRFVYVLPLSPTKALIEYTVFSEQLLPNQQSYDERLERYMQESLSIPQYEILEDEFGVIPMTNAPFEQQKGRVIYIGTAGGHTKASTGYTFKFIQHECLQIAQRLAKGSPPLSPSQAINKYHIYDSVFLKVLKEMRIPPYRIFEDMFMKLPPALPLKFLNESTNLFEDLRIMNSVDRWVFLQATAGALSSL